MSKKRTFRGRFERTKLFAALLPSILLAVFLFWTRQPLIGLLIVGLVVLQMEKLLHTEYILFEGRLYIVNGRFAPQISEEIIHIEKIEICHPTWMGFKRGDCVMLTTNKNKHLLLVPENPEEFCRTLLKWQKEAEDETTLKEDTDNETEI